MSKQRPPGEPDYGDDLAEDLWRVVGWIAERVWRWVAGAFKR